MTQQKPAITDEDFAAVLDMIVEGSSLKSITDANPELSRSSFYRYMDATEGAWDKYARARELGAEADHDHLDWLAGQVEAGEIGAAEGKAAFEIRQWSMGKKASKYDKAVKIDHTSSDGSMTPQVVTYALPDNGRD